MNCLMCEYNTMPLKNSTNQCNTCIGKRPHQPHHGLLDK